MANPAQDLYDLLQGWTVSGGQSPAASRGLSSESMDGWHEQALGAQYLTAIERYLSGMALDGEDVEVYLDHLPAWYAAVYNLALPLGEATSASRRVLDRFGDVTLRSLAAQMRATGYAAPLTDDKTAALLQHLNEAYSLVSEDRTINTTERRHVMSLIDAALSAVNSPRINSPSYVRSAVQEAAGATFSVAIELRQADPSKSHRLATLGAAMAAAVATTLTTEGLALLVNLLSTATGGALPPAH